jgi:hypothetical protein
MTNKKNILRIAQALHNCCKRIKKETNCRDCPFSGIDLGFAFQCTLQGHPIEWADKLRKARERNL